MIYLDNAATSYPKPKEVLKAMTDVLERAGGNPGRSGHRLSVAAARVIYDTREEIASFFGIADPLRVIFTGNATHAINLVIMGLLKPGDRVVVSAMEHNAVMRPLRHLQRQGINLSIVPGAPDGSLDLEQLRKMLVPPTRLVVLVHASNVTGTIMPVAASARIAHEAGAMLLVDAAQSAGVLPINMKELGADFLAFTGHKELLGPPGIGGLVIADGIDTRHIAPLICGGTGSRSDSEEQPEFLPDKFESGTSNLAGIAGLGASIRWLRKYGISEVRSHLRALTRTLMEGLSIMPKIKVYGLTEPEQRVGILSFTVEGKHVSEVGRRLDEEYGVLTRVGLHCAPAAHRTIGSFPEGTVRLSPGVFTTMQDIQKALTAISRVVRS